VDTLIEQEMTYARGICDNALFLALSQFRSEAAAALAEFAYNSPGLVTYNFNGGVHPLVAAYSVFGDAKRHRELELLNVVRSSGRFDSNVLAERSVA
jgi:hypothetical protein